MLNPADLLSSAVLTDIDSPLHISGININSFSYAKVLEEKKS
jgi:hypothetical protein